MEICTLGIGDMGFSRGMGSLGKEFTCYGVLYGNRVNGKLLAGKRFCTGGGGWGEERESERDGLEAKTNIALLTPRRALILPRPLLLVYL